MRRFYSQASERSGRYLITHCITLLDHARPEVRSAAGQHFRINSLPSQARLFTTVRHRPSCQSFAPCVFPRSHFSYWSVRVPHSTIYKDSYPSLRVRQIPICTHSCQTNGLVSQAASLISPLLSLTSMLRCLSNILLLIACKDFIEALQTCHADSWAKWTGGCNQAKLDLNACLRRDARQNTCENL